jgi:hypothetical protein
MSDVNISVEYSPIGLAVSVEQVQLPVTVSTVASAVEDQDEQLIAWTASGGYTLTSATRDSDGVVTTATVRWPDDSTGTFTRTVKNAIFLAIDAYTITHADSGKTITQAAVTRDANGNLTAQPAITVA